jgi:signal transduction histidine kinase
MDNDKRKLMFGIAFFIGIFSMLYLASGIQNTFNEPVIFQNLYYWTALPIIIALFSAVHHTIFNLKKFSLFFKSFIFFVLLSLLILILLPFPAQGFFSPVIIAAGFEIITAALILFLKRREITDFIFLLTALSFMIAGMATAQGLAQYFQMFVFFIGYVFLLLIFAFPNSPNLNQGKGMKDIFTLQQRLSQTTRSLEKTRERYHDLFKHIRSGVAIYEPVDDGNDFVFKDFNKAAENIDHVKHEEVIGKRVTDVFPSVKEFGLLDVFKEVWKTGESKKHPVSFYKDTRLAGWRENTVYRLSSAEIVAVYDDVTQEKQDEIALKQAHRHLQELNEQLDQKVEERTAEITRLLELKNNFIHQLGHDLKNPLGPLINLIPLLEKNDNTPEHKNIYSVLNRNVSYIRNLINRTIRLSQLNNPQIKVEPNEFNLFKEIREVLKKKDVILSENNIEVTVEMDEGMNMVTDRKLLEELFDELLHNAVKYSGGDTDISIRARENEGIVTILVQDNGVGMAREQLEHIFDEFYKADGSRHDFESSGLGMSICKQIVIKLGGRIWVESEGLGKGTIFYVTLPKKMQGINSQNEQMDTKST